MTRSSNPKIDRHTRRDFLKTGAVASALGAGLVAGRVAAGPRPAISGLTAPIVVSTWPFGMQANQAAMAVFKKGGAPLDAAIEGVHQVEADPKVGSVGYGGRPNADGVVQLDAAVMNGADCRCGGVGALERILHPVSVARKVMEETAHVLIVGAGALAFARSKGFEECDLLTDASRKAWETWKTEQLKPGSVSDEENHDTIGMIGLDQAGHLAAAVTTSGLAFKVPGRVGDSPLIGCGLYADDTAGAAVSTGVGEEAIRVLGSFLVVENMRRGAGPLDAVMEALKRVKKADGGRRGPFQLAFLALTPKGEVAGGGLQKGFSYAVTDGSGVHELRNGAVL